MNAYDVIIVGGGVVGCMIARILSRYRLDVMLIEKEADVGAGASAANSAIVHAGYDPLPGTVKAAMNVTASPMWDTLAAELGFAFERCGTYLVAIGPEELPALDSLKTRGIRNGVPGMRNVPSDEMRRREPRLNPRVSGALWVPTGGICDPFGATIAAAENAVQNGVEIRLETAFVDFLFEDTPSRQRRIVGVRTTQGDFRCRWVVNAAGLYADQVMHKAGIRPEFVIRPRRGEYCVLDQAEVTLNHVLFPVPSETSKGILVAPTLHGNPFVGPNAQDIPDREDSAMTGEGMVEIWNGAQKLIPCLNPQQTIAVFAGVRAQGNARSPDPAVDYHHDFLIEISNDVQGLVNLGGIDSPGLTSAPALAVRVVELLKDAGEALDENPAWQPIRKPRPPFHHASPQEQASLLRQDPSYGRVICRCELVTEGDILAEIHAPIPARTYDALKRRTWLGTGRCQGAFDLPRVVQILAREGSMSPLQVSKKGPGSEFLVRETKDLGG